MYLDIPGVGNAVKPGKILCIGRNYAAHAAEMKSAVPTTPMVFLKPSTSLVGSGGAIVIPAVSSDVHHEVELVVAIGRGGKNIARHEAMSHVAAYAAGLDMTARDIQAVAKEKGHPWSVAKGFDSFAPIGEFVSAGKIADPHNVTVRLLVNGETRQLGSTADMIFPIDELVSYCSSIFTLEAGDLIYTGTPEGVGPVVKGDTLVARVDGCPDLTVSVE